MASFRRLRRRLGRRACEALGYDEVDAHEAARELATGRRAQSEAQRARASAESLAHALHEMAFRAMPDEAPRFQQHRGEA